MSRSVKSAERTLALFELFSKRQMALTVGQIANELAVPQPSASMLVKNLTALGYLEHDPTTRRYVPSVRLVLLGSWIERNFSESQSLIKHLDAITRRVKETSYISIQNGVYGQYVVVQRPDKPKRLDVRSGNIIYLTLCASGRALLALKSDDEIVALGTRCNAEVKEERLRINRNDLLRMISDARRDGYAETAGDHTPGFGAVAMTFKLPLSDAPLAVGVGATIQNLKQKHELIVDSLHEFKRAFLT